MMDGDLSHSPEIKLPTFRTVVVLDVVSVWFFSCFPCALFLYYVLRLLC
jgi:membrane protein insertase Oxa1/YidC/SpoIIIJ